ncbi:aldo/keto reductase [Qipengyuania sp. XHP0211]|uniref:aldo/keto reductase n=1 Tax=Qipengyuania sp. XHP0211 TaxID=3038079 RepID=UPI00241EFBDC|nr:aldo/keto reductase [Qipengyuania sp. XHP0211]MDG5750551.1 aldo/keto reductase [Qipengyuania sp. XHP0211]
MEYVNLGPSGLKVSRLCLGCMSYGDTSRGWHGDWVLSEDASRPFIREAVEAGINFFDTANMYSMGASEEVVGKLLPEFAKRDEIVLATKAFLPWRQAPNAGGLSRKSLMQAIDDSLARLNMDYVDLFQIHRWDDHTPIEETMEALHDIVKAGKARYIGASSMAAWQFAKAQEVARANGWTRFISMQNHVNLLYREEEREMIPLCRDQGVSLIPWSPLARGKLARAWDKSTVRSETDGFGKMLYTQTPEADRKIVETVGEIAEARGTSRATVALAWHFAKGVTAPIIGATKDGHIAAAVEAMTLDLTEDEVARLEEPYVPKMPVGVASTAPQNWSLTLKGG